MMSSINRLFLLGHISSKSYAFVFRPFTSQHFRYSKLCASAKSCTKKLDKIIASVTKLSTTLTKMQLEVSQLALEIDGIRSERRDEIRDDIYGEIEREVCEVGEPNYGEERATSEAAKDIPREVAKESRRPTHHSPLSKDIVDAQHRRWARKNDLDNWDVKRRMLETVWNSVEDMGWKLENLDVRNIYQGWDSVFMKRETEENSGRSGNNYTHDLSRWNEIVYAVHPKSKKAIIFLIDVERWAIHRDLGEFLEKIENTKKMILALRQTFESGSVSHDCADGFLSGDGIADFVGHLSLREFDICGVLGRENNYWDENKEIKCNDLFAKANVSLVNAEVKNYYTYEIKFLAGSNIANLS